MTATTVLRRLTSRNERGAEYVGRHRADTVTEVADDWSPLRPADRVALAPHHWQDADRYLPAGPDERTAQVDPAAVLAASTTQASPTQACGTRAAVLAEMRADLDESAAARIEQTLTEVDN